MWEEYWAPGTIKHYDIISTKYCPNIPDKMYLSSDACILSDLIKGDADIIASIGDILCIVCIFCDTPELRESL